MAFRDSSMTGMPAGGLIASGQREVRCNAPGRVHTPLYYNYLAASIGDVHLIKLHALILRMSRGTENATTVRNGCTP